jgi:hypothetical protein
MTTSNAHSITRESFISSLCKRGANGDSAALAILSDPRSQVVNFCEFLQKISAAKKQTLAQTLAQVDPDSLEWLTKTLPKDSPQSTTIKAALLTSRASLPLAVEYHAPGTTQVGFGSNKSPNDIPLITVKGFDTEGKAVSEKKGVRFWSLIIRLSEDPSSLAKLRNYVTLGAIE